MPHRAQGIRYAVGEDQVVFDYEDSHRRPGFSVPELTRGFRPERFPKAKPATMAPGMARNAIFSGAGGGFLPLWRRRCRLFLLALLAYASRIRGQGANTPDCHACRGRYLL
jgi:hypothetical protein